MDKITTNNIFLKNEIITNQNKIEKLKNYEKLANNEVEDKKRKEVAQDFASLFTQMLLKELRKSLHEEQNPLYGGFTEEVFKDMLYEEYSKILTKEGLKPLVDLIYSSTLQMDGLK